MAELCLIHTSNLCSSLVKRHPSVTQSASIPMHSCSAPLDGFNMLSVRLAVYLNPYDAQTEKQREFDWVRLRWGDRHIQSVGQRTHSGHMLGGV